MALETVNVRYMVEDVEAAIAWYTTHLGFTLLSNKPPAFADVGRGALRLLLSGPVSSAGRPMSDGERPGPGGWNRIHLIVDDLPAVVGQLRANWGKVQERYCDRTRRLTESSWSTLQGISSNSFNSPSENVPSVRSDLIHGAGWRWRPARMAKPLSFDLRSRVLAAVDGGLSCRQAAERFGVSASSAIRWAALRRKVGDARPKAVGGDRLSSRTEAHAGLIHAALAETSDITLPELKQKLAAHGAHVSVAALWRFCRRHKITRKKRRRMPRSRIVPTS